MLTVPSHVDISGHYFIVYVIVGAYLEIGVLWCRWIRAPVA